MEPFNIVLIIADAYRRDCAPHFSDTFRLPAPLLPRMQFWHRFQHCFSSAPWTLPSCSSILSGVHSSTHGYFFQNRSFGRRILASYLGRDYHRIGIVNNENLKPFTGFDQDFDDYQCYASHDEPFESATKFLREHKYRAPYFLFFHTNVTHDYYMKRAQPHYQSLFPERSDWFELGKQVTTWSGLSPERKARIRCFYDACVSSVQQRLADLLELVDEDRTIICFVSDHGEGFDYERARIHHAGRLHDDLIAVPLAIHLPAKAPQEHREALSANEGLSISTSDIVPTFLELSGQTVPPGLDGRSMVAHSSVPERSLPAEDKRYLYTATRERFNVNRAGKNTTWWGRTKNRLGQETVARQFNLKAYIEYPYKLIVTSYLRSPFVPAALPRVFRSRLHFPNAMLLQVKDLTLSLELFDLKTDQAESENVLLGLSGRSIGEAIQDRMKGFPKMSIEIGGVSYELRDLLRTPI